ncbi:MAG TPA: chloride channel protein [Gammaproteobacteria bacterium]|nr:chloride channel protein [Gammaproteobacteria bacterium]
MGLMKLDRTPRLLIMSVFLGLVGGLGAELFLLALHWANMYILGFLGHYSTINVAVAHAAGRAPEPFTHWYWWVPLATTVGGLVVGFLIYTFCPEAEGHGTDSAVRAFHVNRGRMRARIPLIKGIASAITIGSGGSAGREGPTAQIAAGVGAIASSWLKLPDDERRIIILMGMAAGLSAIFKSPLGTAIFAVEVLYSGMAFEGGALIYTLISAAVAYAIIGSFDGFTPLFVLSSDVGMGAAVNLVWFAILGLVAGVFGALLPTVFYRVRDGFRALAIPDHFKPAIGGLAVGLIGIALPPLLGGGYGYIQFALQGGAGLAIWLLLILALGKILALALTVGSGGSGGVFAPALYVGAMLGATFAGLLGLFHLEISASALAVVGMAALFAGAARIPIAALVMVIEMTGGYQLVLPTMIAVALAFVVQMALTRRARYPTLYEAQVPGPADSPVYREVYRHTMENLLRRHELKLGEELLDEEMQTALASGEGVTLDGRGERLYHLSLAAGAPLAGRTIRSLGLDRMGVVIVGLIRGEREVLPRGSTRLLVGDGLLVAAGRDAIAAFRKRIAPRASNAAQLKLTSVANAS